MKPHDPHPRSSDSIDKSTFTATPDASSVAIIYGNPPAPKDFYQPCYAVSRLTLPRDVFAPILPNTPNHQQGMLPRMLRSVLIDNSVLACGRFARTITVEVPGCGNRLLLMETLPRPPDSEKWKRTQIEALPSIARAAKMPRQRIQLYTYFELEMEHWRGHNFPAFPTGDIFDGVQIEAISAGLQRSSFLGGLLGDQTVTRDSQMEFCEWLLNEGERILNSPSMSARVGKAQLSALQGLKRYRELCKRLSPVQYVDAFHLWTAELNDIDLFLTIDKKFVNAIRSSKQLEIKCCPVFPEEIILELGVTEREPMPYEYGKRFYLNGLPYD